MSVRKQARIQTLLWPLFEWWRDSANRRTIDALTLQWFCTLRRALFAGHLASRNTTQQGAF